MEHAGIEPDPEKIRAVCEMSEPTNITEVRRLLGMVNHLGKFTPHLAEKTKALRDLLSKRNCWYWGEAQRNSFQVLKKALTTKPILAFYAPTRPTIVSADASAYGIGAVLRQQQPSGEIKPVAYASRSLSKTEQAYAQIEKEGLALTQTCQVSRIERDSHAISPSLTLTC